MSIDRQHAAEAFQQHFGKAPATVVRAPGRVNIIGEHTDYNDGFVLPMAIERDIVIAACPREDGILRAFAVNLDDSAEGAVDQPARNADHSWLDYLMGVADVLAREGFAVQGADLAVLGDVPLASGLSSSAALEMAAMRMFESLGGYRIEGAHAARMGQRVENEFLGLSSGIMDQFISRCGTAGHGLFLDCRTYEYDLVPIAFPGALFVIANSRCARGLTSSKYNERVSECRAAVEGMRQALGHDGTHLRDYTLDDLELSRASLEDIPFRRARHVISENNRTQQACAAMQSGDVARLGELMNASDASLREDYEVTSPELDAMTSIARGLKGCFGARMTGAGFGGCTINLVDKGEAGAFAERLLQNYEAVTGIAGEIIVSEPAGGAEIVF